MSDSERINQKRIDELELRATEAEKFAAGLAEDVLKLKIKVVYLESIVMNLKEEKYNE